MTRLRKLLLGCLVGWLVIAAAAAPPAGYAQSDGGGDGTPVPKVHQVQDGETLTSIAEQYGVTVDEILLVNNLSDGDLIFPGQALVIPGAAGDVVATTYTVQVGDTLAGIAARFNTSAAAVAASNRLVNPGSLYAGETLTLVSRTGGAAPRPVNGIPHVVRPGDTLLSVAAQYGVSPDDLAAANDLPAPARLFPGMRLRVPAGDQPYAFLPGAWRTVRMRPVPIAQGQTASIYVEHLEEGRPAGELAGQPLRFAPYEEGYVALVGLDAFTDPGRVPLRLEGGGARPWWPLVQEVQIQASDFITQFITVPEELSALLEPDVRAEEDAFLSTIYGQFSEIQHWDGLFQQPVSTTVVTAGYGGARSYNGGPFDIFHTGVDFAGGVGTPILAPAGGVVLFSDTLELRGNTVIIDHGLGVMSGYYHLSEIRVQVGDTVTAGQEIGLGGSTGLSTGPHLHWELRVNDVPVNGLQWTQMPFP